MMVVFTCIPFVFLYNISFHAAGKTGAFFIGKSTEGTPRTISQEINALRTPEMLNVSAGRFPGETGRRKDADYEGVSLLLEETSEATFRKALRKREIVQRNGPAEE
ncbi:hypothetical protein [Bacteroides sp.]